MKLNAHEKWMVASVKRHDYGRQHAFSAIRRAKSTRDLERIVRGLPWAGCGWRTANYRTTLERAIKDRKAVK